MVQQYYPSREVVWIACFCVCSFQRQYLVATRCGTCPTNFHVSSTGVSSYQRTSFGVFPILWLSPPSLLTTYSSVSSSYSPYCVVHPLVFVLSSSWDRDEVVPERNGSSFALSKNALSRVTTVWAPLCSPSMCCRAPFWRRMDVYFVVVPFLTDFHPTCQFSSPWLLASCWLKCDFLCNVSGAAVCVCWSTLRMTSWLCWTLY